MAKKKKPTQAPQTIAEALSATARKHGERIALIGPRLQLTHAGLDTCISRAAATLASQGIKPGQMVGVSMATSPLHLVTLLALARLGTGSVHIRTDLAQPLKDGLAAQFAIAALIGDPGQAAGIQADPSWLEPGKAPSVPSRATAQSPWRIALSSGTTGLQKGSLLSHAYTLQYLEQRAQGLPITGADRFLCHRGLDAQLALNPALHALILGGAVVFPESLALGHFIEALERHEVTQTTLSPAYLRDLLDHLPKAKGPFPSLNTMIVSGSRLPAEVMEAALKRVTGNLFATYGTNEFGMLAWSDPDLMRRAPDCAGRIAPGIEAEAVGEDGELRFRRPSMPTSYVANPAASARAFRDGWFHPGDTGRIEGGLLYVAGRVDDKINLDGVKVEPWPIEQVLQSHPAVADAAVFGAAPDGNRKGLFAAAVLRAEVDEKALQAHCRAQVGALYTPLRIFFVDALPRNEAGKVLRANLSQRVARKAAA